MISTGQYVWLGFDIEDSAVDDQKETAVLLAFHFKNESEFRKSLKFLLHDYVRHLLAKEKLKKGFETHDVLMKQYTTHFMQATGDVQLVFGIWSIQETLYIVPRSGVVPSIKTLRQKQESLLRQVGGGNVYHLKNTVLQKMP